MDVAGPDQRTPDLSAVIQEVVNRPGWASGNAIAVIITGTGKRVADSFDGYVYGAPYLHIQYTVSTVTPTPGPTNTPTRTPTATRTLSPTITLTPSRTPSPTATIPTSFSNATFTYDGDGNRVKSIFNGTTATYFVGSYYEVTGSTVTKYYYAGAQRLALRSSGTVYLMLGDHLGSTSLTTSATGIVASEIRYKAWGEVRYSTGTMPTKYTFTGQFSYTTDFGLMYYGARWYDSYVQHSGLYSLETASTASCRHYPCLSPTHDFA